MTDSQMRAGAKYLGERAFKAGKPRTPALDPAVLVMIRQNNGSGIVILKYWCKGWDSANLCEYYYDKDPALQKAAARFEDSQADARCEDIISAKNSD